MTTTIEWTDTTWNPTTGCDRVSPGCDNCYALTMAKRLKAMGSTKYQRDGDPGTSGPGFGLTAHPDTLEVPLRWSTPRRVFVNSMSDLFHAEVPDEFIARVFAVMAATPQHTYQILTKRHARMRSVLSDVCRCGGGHAPGVHFRSQMAWAVSRANPDRVPGLSDDAERRVYHETGWPLPNVWLGVSAENQQWADIRVPALLDTPAAVRFVSAEPMLGPIDLTPYLDLVEYQGGEHRPDVGHIAWYGPRLGWVIVGGESGPRARLMHLDWARDLRDQCEAAGVPFFFKQAGSVLARRWGCTDPKGHNPDEWPEPFPRACPTHVGGAG
ncbi:MAG: phage Gp37/Gp68 family protein [Micromonosporaceae bacterium]